MIPQDLIFLFNIKSVCIELTIAAHYHSRTKPERTTSGPKIRNKGFIIWVDLRDRYGITQLVFDAERTPEAVFTAAQALGREFVIQIKGTVIERESKNPNRATGEIEVLVEDLTLLNASKHPLQSLMKQTEGRNCE